MTMIGTRYHLTTEADPRDRAGVGKRRRLAHPRTVEVLAHGKPFDRGPRRNVLIRDTETGRLSVRPFRGLRRIRG